MPTEQPALPPPPEAPVPEGLDFEHWLGPAPRRPYSEARVHPHENLAGRPGWMQIQDYSLGMILNWGTHLLDIVQWANNTERTGPVEVEGKGTFPTGMLYDVLQELPDRAALMREMHRIVKPGGVISVFPMHLGTDKLLELVATVGLFQVRDTYGVPGFRSSSEIVNLVRYLAPER